LPLTYFSRGMIDRLRQGNWFEDPSNSSIACRQTGPMVIDTIETDEDGEEIFSQRQSLIFKALAVRRVYDRVNDTLIYVSFSRQIQEASAKMAVSTIPLFGTEVTWVNGKPERLGRDPGPHRSRLTHSWSPHVGGGSWGTAASVGVAADAPHRMVG
jgi:CreA protein